MTATQHRVVAQQGLRDITLTLVYTFTAALPPLPLYVVVVTL